MFNFGRCGDSRSLFEGVIFKAVISLLKKNIDLISFWSIEHKQNITGNEISTSSHQTLNVWY